MSINLQSLKPNAGARRRKLRKGRGIAAGQGASCGFGMRGQKSRSGRPTRPGFEGGQMPLYRRLPKRGFNNVNRIDYAVVNLRDIEALEGSTLGLAEFKAQGVLRSNAPLLKVLATGEITRAVTVSAHRFSEAAKQKILAAGGKVIELAVKATKAE